MEWTDIELNTALVRSFPDVSAPGTDLARSLGSIQAKLASQRHGSPQSWKVGVSSRVMIEQNVQAFHMLICFLLLQLVHKLRGFRPLHKLSLEQPLCDTYINTAQPLFMWPPEASQRKSAAEHRNTCVSQDPSPAFWARCQLARHVPQGLRAADCNHHPCRVATVGL
jgi:hypothetical protein